MRKTIDFGCDGCRDNDGKFGRQGPGRSQRLCRSEGFLDVQALTCAQLAGTWQDQADLLSAWYSGWYNGLAKKHYMDIRKGGRPSTN